MVHIVFSVFSDHVVKKRMPPIPLELLACELVLGVHPASETSNLKKGLFHLCPQFLSCAQFSPRFKLLLTFPLSLS